MNGKQVLVIEDDAAIRRGVIDALHFEGYTALDAAAGNEGLALAIGCECDLLLLDLVLPEKDGFAILEQVREQRPNLPVIILTARGEEDDRVRGLRMGADDYIVKPFSVKELLARVHAVLRRAPAKAMQCRQLRCPHGTIELTRGIVTLESGEQKELSPRETQLLRYLAGHIGRCVSREELLTSVWGIDAQGIETRTVDMQVARLREKLGDTAPPSFLVTVRGKGYQLILEGSD